jgi:hypothetical protein
VKTESVKGRELLLLIGRGKQGMVLLGWRKRWVNILHRFSEMASTTNANESLSQALSVVYHSHGLRNEMRLGRRVRNASISSKRSGTLALSQSLSQ